LGNHDRIPRLFAYFEENQEFYLVQEFIEGHDLSQEIIPVAAAATAVVEMNLRLVIIVSILYLILFSHETRRARSFTEFFSQNHPLTQSPPLII